MNGVVILKNNALGEGVNVTMIPDAFQGGEELVEGQGAKILAYLLCTIFRSASQIHTFHSPVI